MGFYEDIAEALDRDGIEARVNDSTLFVPITSELEMQFVAIDAPIPAANVYVAVADVTEDDEEFEAALVGAVFSVEDAVEQVAKHVVTDQIVTVLRDILEGTDDRISDLEFTQDHAEPLRVRAEIGDTSELVVTLTTEDNVPAASVEFVTFGDDFEDLLDQVIAEVWGEEADDEGEPLDPDRQQAFNALVQEVAQATQEVLELGTFTDFDTLFDVLAVAQSQARDWEEQLVPLDDGWEEMWDEDWDDDEDEDDDELADVVIEVVPADDDDDEDVGDDDLDGDDRDDDGDDDAAATRGSTAGR